MDKKSTEILNQKKLPRIFSIEQKKEIIDDYLNSGLTKKEIWRKYTDRSSEHGEILRWMKKLGYEFSIIQKSSRFPAMNSTFKTPKDSDEVSKLNQKIKRLEKALEDAELEATAYSSMVDIAEKTFNIPIRKKSDTK